MIKIDLRVGGGGVPLRSRPFYDRRENVHACKVKCIQNYGNFIFLKNSLICICMVIYANKIREFTFLLINHI